MKNLKNASMAAAVANVGGEDKKGTSVDSQRRLQQEQVPPTTTTHSHSAFERKKYKK